MWKSTVLASILMKIDKKALLAAAYEEMNGVKELSVDDFDYSQYVVYNKDRNYYISYPLIHILNNNKYIKKYIKR